MSPGELICFNLSIVRRFQDAHGFVDQLDVARRDSESTDYLADSKAEALFLRIYTSYERDLEVIFLHYVSGGRSLNGLTANTYLKVTSEEEAQRIVYAGKKYLQWAKPEDTRATAELYLENGWPIKNTINIHSQVLCESTYIRNQIAHRSEYAKSQFDKVQRNLLTTERIFPITAGQLLRIKHSRLNKLHITYYIDAMYLTLFRLMMPERDS